MAKTRKAKQSALQCAESEYAAEYNAEIEEIAKTLPEGRPSFFERVRDLAYASKPISQELLDEGVRRRVDANLMRRMFVVFKTATNFKTRDDAEKELRSFWEYLNRKDDVALDEFLKKHNDEDRNDIERVAFDDRFELLPGDDENWRCAHPDRIPGPGEIVRWTRKKRQDEESARIHKAILKDKALEIAQRERNKTPPAPNEEELREVFEMWWHRDWQQCRSWPTSAQVKLWTGLSQDEILDVVKKGRWGDRNVYRGGACRSKTGGRPPEQILPRGVANIVRSLAKSFPALSIEAKKLARFLDKQI